MRLYIYLMFIILTVSGARAQTLKGFVFELDENEKRIPLAGSNVYWEGTQMGVSTDLNGFFELKKIESDHLHLVVSYIGYKPDTLDIPNDLDSIEIVLSVNRELQEVVVSGTSLSKYFDELDARQTEVITSKELLKAACCNLAESFTTNASVDVQFQDAVTGAKQIQLLGLAGTYTQMMIENIPTLKGIGSVFGLGYVPGPWMTHISISKGSASVVNGYESITGQINLDYKKPDDMERHYFNVFQSSHYKMDLNANSAVQLSENLSTLLLAHSEFNQKSLDHNHDSFADQPKVKQFNFMNRWKYQSFTGFESQFGVQVLDEKRRGGQISSTHSGLHQGEDYKINIDTKRYEVFAKNGFVFDDEPYTSMGLILSAQFHQQNSLFGKRIYNADQKSFYSNLLFQSNSSDGIHSITAGGSYVYDHYDEKFDTLNFIRNESRPGVFAEYNFSPEYFISVVPGVRVDFHNLFGTFFTPRIHIRYAIDENTTLRLSAGKGYRSVNIFSDNLSYLVSSRKFVIVNQPTYEEGINYGFNLTRYITIADKDMRVTFDYYRTEFQKQTVVDIDTDAREVRFYDLNGSSYSNNYQLEIYYQLFDRLDIGAAYRYTDVKTQYGQSLLTKPLIGKYKGLLTLSYFTDERNWVFDSSFLLNGGGRIPSTVQNPVEHQRKESFGSYININAQLTKKLDILELYLGVENLTDFKQDNPVISPDEPFGEYFDASLVWGPVEGRKFYAGLRLSIF
ncbi:MAG: TonB-dependent receptor [Ignavibacteriales bacterium]|nr:MAG: TonB-dependent receptor [Ignavibacteriales bacterium]